jgi:hypothetical protein
MELAFAFGFLARVDAVGIVRGIVRRFGRIQSGGHGGRLRTEAWRRVAVDTTGTTGEANTE